LAEITRLCQHIGRTIAYFLNIGKANQSCRMNNQTIEIEIVILSMQNVSRGFLI
jgi:hypothetical protein